MSSVLKSIFIGAIPILLLTRCAQANLQSIHNATMQRITYKHYSGQDHRYVPKGERAEGNCSRIAYTNLRDVLDAGYSAWIVGCHTPQEEGHAYVKVFDMALDNRFNNVIPLSEEDCK